MALETTEFETKLVGTDEASPAYDAAAKSAEKATKIFDSLGGKIVVVNQAFELAKGIFNSIQGPIEEVTAAYVQQERAQAALANSLKISGSFSEQSFENLASFAKVLEETSRVSEETATNMLALGKTIGLTDKQVKTMVQTAINLSEVTGKDVNSVMNELIGQLSGVPGRILKIIPGMKELTEEQLRMGVGIDRLAKKFDGFAQNSLKGVDAALARESNAFDSLIKQIGKSFTSLAQTERMLKIQTELWSTLEHAVKGVEAVIRSLSKIDATSAARSIEALAVAFAAIAAPSLISSLTAAIPQVVRSLSIALVALARFSGSALAFSTLAAEAVALAVAIDFVAGNLERIPQLLSVVGAAFTVFIARSAQGWRELELAGLLAMEAVLEIAEKIPGMAGMAHGGLKFLREDIVNVRHRIEDLGGASEDAAKAAELAFKEIKPGPLLDNILKAIKAFKDAANGAKEFGQNAETAFENAAEASKSQRSDLLKIANENLDIETKLRQMDMGEVEKIEDTLQLEKQKLNAMRMQLDLSTQFGREMDDQIAKQIKLKEQLAAAEIANTPIRTQAMDALTKPGPGASEAGKAWGKAAKGMIDGSISEVVGAVSTVAGIVVEIVKIIVDAVPKFIESIGELIDGVTNFIPNLLKGIANIWEKLMEHFTTQFVQLEKGLLDFESRMDKMFSQNFELMGEQMGEALARMVDAVPNMIDKALRSLEKLIPEFADGFLTALIEAFSSKEVQSAMIGAFRNAIYTSLLYSNIWITIGYKLVKAFNEAMKGQTITPQINTAAMNQTLQDLANRSSDQLFKVMDMAQEAKGLAASERIAESIRQGTDYLVRAMRLLIAAWRGLWDNIVVAWRGAWDNILAGWQGFWNNVVLGNANFIIEEWKRGFQWINDNVFSKLSLESISNAFSGVSGMFSMFSVENLTAAFTSARDSISGLFNIQIPEQPGWINDLTSSLSGLFDTPGWLSSFIDTVETLVNTAPGGGGGINIPKPPGFRHGGHVEFARDGYVTPRGIDNRLVMAHDGEAFLSRESVRANQGIVDSMIANPGKTVGGGTVNNYITVNAKTTVDGPELKRIIMATADDLKRKSQEGRHILAPTGVR